MRTPTTKRRRSPMHDAQLSELGESYLALIEANHRRPVTERLAAERERHQSTRPCPLCRAAMTDGACAEHGTPAEDGGAWLWAR